MTKDDALHATGLFIATLVVAALGLWFIFG